MDLLLQHGARIDASDKNGKTPLYIAVLHGYLTIAEMLLVAGANACDANSLPPPPPPPPPPLPPLPRSHSTLALLYCVHMQWEGTTPHHNAILYACALNWVSCILSI